MATEITNCQQAWDIGFARLADEKRLKEIADKWQRTGESLSAEHAEAEAIERRMRARGDTFTSIVNPNADADADAETVGQKAARAIDTSAVARMVDPTIDRR